MNETIILCQRCGSAALPSGICPACMASDLAEADSDAYFSPAGDSSGAAPPFTIVSLLGRGGMGQVFRAHQSAPAREIAVKMLSPHLAASPDCRRRLLAEAAAMSELDHPAILPVYAAGELDGIPYFTMRLVEGGTLSAAKPRLTGRWREMATVMSTVADAVHHAHERGVLHRDLKPGNILFDAAGHPFVSDFGLAKLAFAESAAESLTHSAQLLGTPGYMAPEIAGGSMKAATTASDVYALGAILYELLCGEPPFAADSVQSLLRKIVEADPLPLEKKDARIPRDLAAIAHRAMEKRPAARYDSAATFAADLRAWLEGKPVSARAIGSAGRLARWARRRPAVAALASACVALAITGSFMQFIANQRLRTALNQARHERRAAEGLIGFMNGDLSGKLEQVGRLDFLADVGSRIDEYFRSQDSRELPDYEDAASRLQKARLFNKRARILVSQGNPDAGISAARSGLGLLGAGESLDAAEARLWEGRGLRASVRLDEAVACLTKAADDLQGEPGAKERDLLGEVLLTLGDCLVDNNQAAAAVLIADKMRTLALPVPADPVAADRLAFHAARSGYVRGRALFLLDEDERAREALDTYQNGVEAISRRHPENVIWTAALAESWNHAAYAAAGREDYKTELEAYRKAHELSRQLCSRDPSNVSWFRELSLSYRCLAGSLARLGRTQESLAEVQNYLTTCRPILSRAGASPVENRELAEGLREIAVLMQGFEEPVQALALHQQAIELCLALIRSEPWNDRNFWGFCESVEACAGLATHANPPTNAKAVFQKWIDFAHNEASARTESAAAWRDAEASLYARCGGQLQSEHDMLGAADQMSQAVKLREANLSVNSKSAKALSSSFMWLTDAQIRAHRTEAAIATVDRHVSLWEQRFGAAGPHLPGAYDLVKAGSLLKRVLDNGEHGIEVQALASRILALIDLPDASESDLNRLKHLSELRLLAPPPTHAAPPL